MENKSAILKFKELYSNITLKEFYDNIDMFKSEYDKIKQSSYVKLHEMREWKNWVYSLKMAEYKRDKIWEFLNNDLTKEEFEHFVIAVHKNWFK